MRSDETIFAAIRRHLFTAVIGDVLDAAGFQRQFLPPRLRPLDRSLPVLVGRAMTVQESDIEPGDEGEPFGLMFRALDDLKPEDRKSVV